MEELPRDIQLKIISKMDIDSRIKMGIYSKLQIPIILKNKLEKLYNKNKIIVDANCMDYNICLGLLSSKCEHNNLLNSYNEYLYIINHCISKYNQKSMYFVLNRSKIYENGEIKFKIMHIV